MHTTDDSQPLEQAREQPCLHFMLLTIVSLWNTNRDKKFEKREGRERKIEHTLQKFLPFSRPLLQPSVESVPGGHSLGPIQGGKGSDDACLTTEGLWSLFQLLTIVSLWSKRIEGGSSAMFPFMLLTIVSLWNENGDIFLTLLRYRGGRGERGKERKKKIWTHCPHRSFLHFSRPSNWCPATKILFHVALYIYCATGCYFMLSV